jgi:16S rRNA (cytosine1402-N4)-methyltransferase
VDVDAIATNPDHIPVLLDEVLKNLVQSTDGTYVDGTFGRGGHARALLGILDPDARVIALDRDPAAIASARALAVTEPRLTICHARFSQLAEVLADQGVAEVQGVLLDLGVSSPQLDDAERGFSFRFSGPLDMRMNPNEGESAAQWLDTAEEADIARVLKDYGEERFARRIARAIVAARPLTTTEALADVVAQVVPVRGRQTKHPATKTFQAIRIYINEETSELALGIRAAFDVLAEGGRLAIISFHSLEDREVKHTFRSMTRPPELPRRIPVRHQELQTPARNIIGPVRAGARELQHNPRARSATLRVIEKVHDMDKASGHG